LELVHLARLRSDDPPRRVAAADAHRHPAVRNVLPRGIPARGDRRVADARIRDAVAELDALRLRSGDREEGVALLPEDVRVVGPAVLEAEALALLEHLDEPRVRRVRQDGDSEAEHAPSRVGGKGMSITPL